MADASSPYLTLDQLAAVAAPGRDPSQREQIIASADLKASPYAVKNWLDQGSGSDKAYAGGTTRLYEGHQYTLVDNKTGEVLAQGSTPEAIQKIQSIVDNQLAPQGRKADWRLYDATPDAGVTNMHERMPGIYTNFSAPGDPRGAVVAGNTPDASTLGNIGKAVGTILPYAMIPLTMGASAPLAGLGTAGTIGLGAGVGGVSAGLKGQNVLKGALMGGATAAGGQLLGGATGPLSKLGLATDVANAVGTGIGATGGGLATGQSLANSLKGGVIAGAGQYAASKLFAPSQVEAEFQRNLSQNVNNTIADMTNAGFDLADAALIDAGYYPKPTPSAAPSAAPSSFAVAPASAPAAAPNVDPAMVVTGTRLPGPTFFGGSNVIPTARYSGDGPTPSEIIVKGQKDVPATEDKALAVNPVVPTTTTPDEIIVKGQKDVPATEDKPLAVNPVVPTTPTTPDEIIVKGQKDVPAVEDKPLSVNMTGIGDLINSDDFQKTVAEEEADIKKKSDAEKIADYMRLAGLGVGLVGNIFGGGKDTGAGTGRYNTGKGALNPIFSAKLPTTGTAGSFTVGGLGGTAGGTDPLAARPTADWYRYATGPAMDIPEGTDLSSATSPYAGFGPSTLGEETFKQVTGMSHGGAMGYARGSSRDSFAVEGPGTGRSDDIPAVLSDGEYVIDAETVALLGDGSSRAGAKKLDDLRVKVRKHKGKNLAKGKFSVNAKHPEAYMLGGRI